MKSEKKFILGLVMSLAFMGMVLLGAHLSEAGDLEPPSGAVAGGQPVATMHTLGEIYNQLGAMEGKLDVIDGKIDPAPVACEGAPVMETGQKATHISEDDGFLQMGVPWPDPRFTDNGNETVTDNLTGLMWTRDANLAEGTKNWSQAMAFSAALELGEFTDWRLPNVRELQSLIDYGKYNPALPNNHPFINVQTSVYDCYWSSTTDARSTNNAWCVAFGFGNVEPGGKSSYGYGYVWCVRGGS